ncbi:hypothetical protein Hanom_Chr11g01046761 [Helianthus anomalus]
MLENIMTKQGLGFVEELHNATCLNTDINIKVALLQEMFKCNITPSSLQHLVNSFHVGTAHPGYSYLAT